MITPQYIKDYLQEKLESNYRISSSGNELIMPSIFIKDDHKRHMSINLDTGLWQCFKTGNTGNFIKLYSIIESLPYRKAEAKILFQGLENGTLDLWNQTLFEPEEVERGTLTNEFSPVNINSYDSENPLIVKAWTFLMDRKLFDTATFDEEPYYVATEGKYKGRVIIPFKDEDNDLFYFQGRALSNDIQPKYLNPGVENGVKSSNILYPFDYEADHLCICEGPLDAISLKLNGLNATCTVGSSISTIQMQLLKEFKGKIILAYDNDAAGERGIGKFERLRKSHLLPTFNVLTPPSNFKDWNEAHMAGRNLYEWAMEKAYEYNYENITLKQLD